MSISEREQRALDSIENDLARSGPGLASMLAMFSRLTAGEEMPPREGVRPVIGVAARCLGSRRIGRPAWQWLWLAAAIALVVVLALTIGGGTGKSACPASRTARCAHAPAPAQSAAGTNAGL